MVPAPITTTRAPTRSPAMRAAWTGVARHSTSTPSTSETSSGTGKMLRADATTYVAMPPGSAPEGSQPIQARLWQALVRPARQLTHSPQPTFGLTTARRPTSAGSTPGPAVSTTPTISCPGRYGGGSSGWCPATAWVSEPQIPA